MTELTPEYIEQLMRNVPAGQQEIRDAISIKESAPGSVVYEIDVPRSWTNLNGGIFGGFINLMAEAAAGMATFAYGVRNVAITSSTNFIRAVAPQRLVVSAETTHKGRTTSVCHIVIRTPEEKLIAETTFTMFILGPLE